MNKTIKYDRHEDEYEKCLTDENRKKIAETWMEKGRLDRWRHERMLKLYIIYLDLGWVYMKRLEFVEKV